MAPLATRPAPLAIATAPPSFALDAPDRNVNALPAAESLSPTVTDTAPARADEAPDAMAIAPDAPASALPVWMSMAPLTPDGATALRICEPPAPLETVTAPALGELPELPAAKRIWDPAPDRLAPVAKRNEPARPAAEAPV